MRTVTFSDHNQYRDNPEPYKYEGQDIRLVYNRVCDETKEIAEYVEGTDWTGSGDGWLVEETGHLYSDINLGSN